MSVRSVLGSLLACALLVAPSTANAFGGFYVGRTSTTRSSSRSHVVIFREGTRTVISLQRDYAGPAEELAWVIPLPAAVERDAFTQQSAALLSRVERLAAPRLVELDEQDPCAQTEPGSARGQLSELLPSTAQSAQPVQTHAPATSAPTPTQAAPGPVDLALLRGEDARSAATWLRAQGYALPEGAEAMLQAQTASGQSVAVVRVRADAPSFDGDKATLPPLRFHYDDEALQLPAGLVAPDGVSTDALLLSVVSKGQRYEVEGHPEAFIPTNLDLSEQAKDRFDAFYNALFDRTVRDQPGSVVTEYAWSIASCDACSGPTLGASDLLALGLEVIPSEAPRAERSVSVWPYTLTRLHAKHDASAAEPWRLVKAPAVEGGREHNRSDVGRDQEPRILSAGINTFQARYAIRRPFRGALTCTDPSFEVWSKPAVIATATSLTEAPEPALTSLLASDLTRFGLRGSPPVVARSTSATAAAGTWLRSARGSLATGFLTGLIIVAVLQRKARRAMKEAT